MKEEPKFKVLIIEDGLVNQKILMDTLQETYTVHAVASGKEAMKAAKRFHPHLILLDIILPDINGFDLLKMLKDERETQDIPVIIITGLDNDSDEERGLSIGAVDYIRKPFSRFLVRARVDIHVQIVKQLLTIQKLSFFDALTGLANRRKFDYHFEYEWHRAVRKQTTLGLMMMDLDEFKNYNDTYGHAQGDAMLRAVANVLRFVLKRSTDIPCRWGGEEFAVLLPETTPETMLMLAEKIRSEIEIMEVPSARTNETTKITVSIGAAFATPGINAVASEFIEKADRLLYQAKHDGRNRVQS